jgi:type II restriction enzyme
MRQAIIEDRTPGLFLLQYSRREFRVKNVLLIPHFAFNESMLQCRKPLSPQAARAGWIGCNFLLDKIPADARIPVVDDGSVIAPAVVRHSYSKLRPLEKLEPTKRGWTLDVLNVVHSLDKKEFSLGEVYDYERALTKLHPDNRHVRDKIRQQLQILRDLGLLEFLGNGSYRLV